MCERERVARLTVCRGLDDRDAGGEGHVWPRGTGRELQWVMCFLGGFFLDERCIVRNERWGCEMRLFVRLMGLDIKRVALLFC